MSFNRRLAEVEDGTYDSTSQNPEKLRRSGGPCERPGAVATRSTRKARRINRIKPRLTEREEVKVRKRRSSDFVYRMGVANRRTQFGRID